MVNRQLRQRPVHVLFGKGLAQQFADPIQPRVAKGAPRHNS
jgi:hypothetical protein